jgi:hypothetical protein
MDTGRVRDRDGERGEGEVNKLFGRRSCGRYKSLIIGQHGGDYLRTIRRGIPSNAVVPKAVVAG